MSTTNDNALQVNQLPVSVEIPANANTTEIIMLLYKRIARAVNTKEGSIYDLVEQGNFQQYYILNRPFFYRPAYRKTFDMVSLNGGPIAPGATASFIHNIVGITQTVNIFGSATNSDAPVKYLPLPYVSATVLTDQVQIFLTPTNVVLINGATQTALTSASVVGEYLKT